MKNIKTSKMIMAIIDAVEKGVKPTSDGFIIRKRRGVGAVAALKKVGKNRRYWAFNHYYQGKNVSIPVHQFICYYKFGKEYTVEGMVARHLDDNPNNNRPRNIANGTVAQNMEDKALNNMKKGTHGFARTSNVPALGKTGN